jgi:hypothetical protein
MQSLKLFCVRIALPMAKPAALPPTKPVEPTATKPPPPECGYKLHRALAVSKSPALTLGPGAVMDLTAGNGTQIKAAAISFAGDGVGTSL